MAHGGPHIGDRRKVNDVEQIYDGTQFVPISSLTPERLTGLSALEIKEIESSSGQPGPQDVDALRIKAEHLLADDILNKLGELAGGGSEQFDPKTARLVEIRGSTGDVFQVAVDANGVVGASRFVNAPVQPKTGFSLFTNPQNGDILQVDLSTGNLRLRPDGSPHIVLKGEQQLTQADIRAFNSLLLGDGSSLQVVQIGTTTHTFRLDPEQTQTNLTVSHTIDTDLDGMDDHAVLSDQKTLVALSAPDTSIDPKNVAIASEVELKDGSTIVTLNTEQAIHLSAPTDKRPPAKVAVDGLTGRIKVTQPDGSISFLAPDAIQPTADNVIRIGGRDLLFNPNTGGLTDVTPQAEAGVVVKGGREFVQQPDGTLKALAPEDVPSMDDLINTRLISGDADGALALADFRDRPTSLEAFNAAMQFAQAPGDVAAISAIARGQTLVQPPPAGEVRRIAEPPAFLQDTFSRLMNQMRGGTGTPGEFVDVLSRISQENEERGRELAAREQELDAANAKAQQADIQAQIDAAVEAAVAPFRAEAAKPAVPTKAEVTATLLPEGQVFTKGTQRISTRDPAHFGELEAAGFTRDSGFTGDPSFTKDSGFTGDPPFTKDSGSTGDPAFISPSPPPSAFEPQAGKFIDPRTGQEYGDIAELESALVPPPPPVPTLTSGLEEILDTSTSRRQRAAPMELLARGGTMKGQTAIVGENGPELIQAAPGTRVIPLSKVSKKDLIKLRKIMGIQSFQDGGTVAPLLPFGVRRALSGGLLEPTRRRLSTAAGLPVLSAQGQQNISPDEFDVITRLSREAGISDPEFRRELRSAQPGLNVFRRPARYVPRVLR